MARVNYFLLALVIFSFSMKDNVPRIKNGKRFGRLGSVFYTILGVAFTYK